MSKAIFVELMYTALRFVQKAKFGTEKAGTVLSLYYLSHQFFLSSLYTTVSQIREFFNKRLLLHCIEVRNFCIFLEVLNWFLGPAHCYWNIHARREEVHSQSLLSRVRSKLAANSTRGASKLRVSPEVRGSSGPRCVPTHRKARKEAQGKENQKEIRTTVYLH